MVFFLDVSVDPDSPPFNPRRNAPQKAPGKSSNFDLRYLQIRGKLDPTNGRHNKTFMKLSWHLDAIFSLRPVNKQHTPITVANPVHSASSMSEDQTKVPSQKENWLVPAKFYRSNMVHAFKDTKPYN
jgi:hypothetical protein